MSISPHEREKVARRLGAPAAEQDVDLVVNVLEALAGIFQRATPARSDFKYDVAAMDAPESPLVLSWTRGLALLRAADVEALVRVSARFESASVDVERGRLELEFSSYAAPRRERGAPAQHRKRRRRDFDFGAARVSDEDDRASLERLVDDVYASEQLMPALSIGLEPIVDRRAPLACDDASETDVEGAAPEGARIGYSLYFGALPRLSAELLTRLVDRRRHPNALDAYVWFRGDALEPLLVVNVRRPNELSAADAPGSTAVAAYRPHSLDVSARRVRRK